MFRKQLPLIMAFQSLSTVGIAKAHADALVPGSTFDVVVATYNATTESYVAANTFTETTGGTLNASYNGVSAMLTEHESFISGGTTQIVLDIKGASDFFTETSSDTLLGFLAAGAYGDPMKFATPVKLLSAVISFSNAGGVVYGGDVTSFVSHRTPFDGSFVNSSSAGVIVGPVQNRASTTSVLPSPSRRLSRPAWPTRHRCSGYGRRGSSPLCSSLRTTE